MKNRVQISTDGLAAYVAAIETACGKHNVDYGQFIKTYGTEESVAVQRRYSAPKIKESEKRGVLGYPDWDFISTSYVERLNATTRLHMKRLVGCTSPITTSSAVTTRFAVLLQWPLALSGLSGAFPIWWRRPHDARSGTSGHHPTPARR